MKSTLIKIFAKGFYKKYAKAFLLGFCMFFSYCIFIQTAGEFLTESKDFWTMLISLKVATDPVFIGLFWVTAIIYVIILLKYIRFELIQERNSFLQYTLNGMKSSTRRNYWAVVILIGLLPLIVYACYSLLIGYYLANNLRGGFSLLYLLGLLIVAVLYIDHFRLISITDRENPLLRYSTRFNKGQLHLFNLYNHINHNLATLIVSKSLSLLTIYVLISLFGIKGTENDIRYVIYITMTLGCINAVLLYKDFVFEGQSMIFMLNFPSNRIKRFILPIPYYLILVLPEIIYLAFAFRLQSFSIAVLSIIIFILAIKSFIFSFGNRPLSVIKCISTYYFIALILILYGLQFIVLFLTLILSIILFMRNFTYEKLVNNQN